MWNLWKEKNQWIFQNKRSTPLMVALQAKEDIEQWRHAFRNL
jgi:hypothetical protein